MSNPNTVIDNFYDYFVANFNTALTTATLPTVSSIVIGSIDVIKYAGNNLFILPDNISYEPESIGEDKATVNIRCYIILKNVSNIWTKIYGMVECFRALVYGNMVSTIGVQSAFISMVDFFEGYDESVKVEERIAEINIQLTFNQEI